MNVCLDIHDWSIVNNRLDLLLKLKQIYPGFKVSCFTVPIDKKEGWGPSLNREKYLAEIKKHLDWIQIIPHGLYHNGHEMDNVSYETFTSYIIPTIQETFEKDGLPYEKGFCAPHWRWTKGIVMALDSMGWWGAVDRRQPNMLSTKRFYKYSHCLDEQIPVEGEVKLHGHAYGTKNDLEACFNNLFNVPRDAVWHFVTDYLEDYDNTM